MGNTRRRLAGGAVAAAAAVGLLATGAGQAQAAAWQYVANYPQLYKCQDVGKQYVHYGAASDWKCTGNYATGYSLYVIYSA
ncbi:hypothetical protein [Streptodolium elevatio]